MILIITALRIEAAPFIDYYKLKRDMTFKRHEVFKNQTGSVMLLITRPGKLPAAIALTELLSGRHITSYDYMINIGICGMASKAANTKDAPMYLCHSILDHDTGKTYYPDILIKHPFNEASLETFSAAVNSENADTVSASLVDMESSALFEAGNYHFATHQMYFVKIPSDMLNPSLVTKETVSGLISTCAPTITTWIDELINTSSDMPARDDNINPSDEELILFNRLSASLRLSTTMKEQLKQLFIYKKLNGGDFSAIENFVLPNGNISNQKRKIIFDELRELFLQ